METFAIGFPKKGHYCWFLRKCTFFKHSREKVTFIGKNEVAWNIKFLIGIL